MQYLMARPANTEQLPLPRVWVKDGQCQVWPVFQVLHMVHQIGGADAVTAPAYLAFVVIHVQGLPAHALPLWPIIKPV